MDFKSLLQSMTTLSEGETKETSKGREHKGTYGTSHGKEDVRDQYGHKIGRVDKDKDDKAKKDDAPKKRGRPTKAAKDETGADIKHDTSGIQSMLGKKPNKEVGKVSKKHSLKEYIEEAETALNESEQLDEISDQLAYDVNQARAGQHFAAKDKADAAHQQWARGDNSSMKQAQNVSTTAQAARDASSKLARNTELQKSRGNRLGKQMYEPATGQSRSTPQSMGTADMGLTRMKAPAQQMNHNYEESIEERDMSEDMTNQAPIQIKPASQTNTQVIQQGNKTLGTVTNPQLAAQIKQSIGKGEMTLNTDDQEMSEDGGEKWIQKAIKHPGALTKKAKSAGMSTSAFAKKHAHDSGTTGKQARLAQTLGKMHESLQANGMVLTEGQKEQMIKFFDELELGPKGYNIKPAVELKDKGLATSVINKTLAHGRFRSMSGTYKDQMRDAALEHFGFTNYEESLEEGDLVPHPSKDMYRQHAIQNGKDLKPGDISAFKPSRIQAPSRPVEEPTPWKVDPINAATDRAINFISGLRKPKNTLESKEDMKDVQFESWENQLKSMLTEGITVSSSTGQQGSPDSVTISASDADAEQLLGVLRNAGIGVFGGNQKPEMTPYGAPAGEQEPTGTGTEPESSPEVVGDGDDMLSLIKKMAGIDMGTDNGSDAGAQDYEDEEGSDDTALQPADSDEGDEACDDCGHSPCSCDDHEGEEKTDEGNDFTEKLKKTPKGGKFSIGGKTYTDTSNLEEDDMEEGAGVMHYKAQQAKADGEKSFKLGDKEFPVKEEENMHKGHDHDHVNESNTSGEVERRKISDWLRDPRLDAQVTKLQIPGLDITNPQKGLKGFDSYGGGMSNSMKDLYTDATNPMYFKDILQYVLKKMGDVTITGIMQAGPQQNMQEGTGEECNECGYTMESCQCDTQVEEGFSNDAGGDAMADTELMKLKELLSMGGDLHKLKRSQAVGNPTQVTLETTLMKNSSDLLVDYKRLSGIK